MPRRDDFFRAKGALEQIFSAAHTGNYLLLFDEADSLFGSRSKVEDSKDRYANLETNFLLQRLLGLGTPMLGVCLGAQLLAKAARAHVYPCGEPEIGWHPVELTDDAADDPVFARLPTRFHAFQWHYYTHDVPAGASQLAHSGTCTQAFRLGGHVWGVQFHPEVRLETIESWLAAEDREVPGSRDALRAETAERIGEWNALGKDICGGFLTAAERVAAAA